MNPKDKQIRICDLRESEFFRYYKRDIYGNWTSDYTVWRIDDRPSRANAVCVWVPDGNSEFIISEQKYFPPVKLVFKDKNPYLMFSIITNENDFLCDASFYERMLLENGFNGGFIKSLLKAAKAHLERYRYFILRNDSIVDRKVELYYNRCEGGLVLSSHIMVICYSKSNNELYLEKNIHGTKFRRINVNKKERFISAIYGNMNFTNWELGE